MAPTLYLAPRKFFNRAGRSAGLMALALASAIFFLVAFAAPRSSSGQAAAPAPIAKKHIYSETADPRADIAAGIKQAHKEHKRVLIDFGGDWCGDCQVLDIYFHQDANAALLDANYVVVHVWIGHMDRNIDIAQQYGVPIKSGVPALAVLSDKGKVLYAQETGEFRDMRHMDTSSVTTFLEKWKKS